MPWTQVREKSWRGAVSEVWVGMGPHSGAQTFSECLRLLRNHGASCFNIRILLMKKRRRPIVVQPEFVLNGRSLHHTQAGFSIQEKDLWLQQPQRSIDLTQLCTKNPAAEQCSTQEMLTLAADWGSSQSLYLRSKGWGRQAFTSVQHYLLQGWVCGICFNLSEATL